MAITVSDGSVCCKSCLSPLFGADACAAGALEGLARRLARQPNFIHVYNINTPECILGHMTAC